MKINKYFLLFVFILTLLSSACAPQALPQNNTAESGTSLEFTSEELAKFNGENGAKAYIAVDGVVYDVTEVPFWKGGKHNGFVAGKDLSKEIKTVSPHGTSKLDDVPVVGTLK